MTYTHTTSKGSGKRNPSRYSLKAGNPSPRPFDKQRPVLHSERSREKGTCHNCFTSKGNRCIHSSRSGKELGTPVSYSLFICKQHDSVTPNPQLNNYIYRIGPHETRKTQSLFFSATFSCYTELFHPNSKCRKDLF